MPRQFIIRHPDREEWLTQYGFKAGVAARELAMRFNDKSDAETHVRLNIPVAMRNLKFVFEPFTVSDDPAPVGHQAATEYDPYGLNRHER